MFELYASVYSTLVARHIPGKRNVLADSSSRGACGNRRMDPQPVFLAICQLWGSPTIDLFAARRNTRLLTFGSPIPDMTRSIDVMSLDWKDMWGYRYPPDAILPLIFRKILLALRYKLGRPVVAAACCFELHLLLLVDCPQILPLLPDLLT